MIFSSHSDAKQANEKLNTNVKNRIEFFESHRLTINTDKTEFTIFFANQTATQTLMASDYRSKIKKSMF